MNYNKKLVKDEKGAVAVLVAILLTVFIGVTALVVDYGFLAYTRRDLQIAADAAALAGAQEMLILGDEATANQALIYQKVKEYAEINGISESELIPAPDIDVDKGYVKVVVERDVSNFFAHVIGFNTSKVAARAKAKIVWISGLGGLTPFGVIDVRPDEVWAGFEGNMIKLADDNNDSVYAGSVTAPASSGSHNVIVKTVDFDAPTNGIEIDQAAAVMVEPTIIEGVTMSLNPSPLSGAVTAMVAVEATATPDSVKLIVGSVAHNLAYKSMDASGNYVFSGTFTAPSTTGIYSSYAEVTLAGITDTETVGPIAYLRVIDGYSVIGEVSALPTTVSSGDNTYLSVEIKGFEYGMQYDLKLGSDPYAGNFMALAFDDETGGKEYSNNIIEGSTYEYYIGDIVYTEPGNKQGPTDDGLTGRIGDDKCYWDTTKNYWVDPGTGEKHLDCPRLVTVPLVASTGYTDGNGRHEMVITGFATFFIESWTKDNIKGYFVEYPEIGKGWTEEDPNDPLRPKTVRLVPFD